jgi:hypothetical protein
MGQRISLMLTQAAKATGLSEAAILARHRGGADRRHEGYAGCLARRPYRALPRCNGKHSYKCQEDAEQTREALLAINEDARRELWAMIDSRLWFVKMVLKDYAGQLEEIDRELEAELSR